MKDSTKKIFLIGICMLAVIIINFFFPNLLSNNKEIILLIVSLILLKFLVGFDFKRDSGDKKVIRNILIYILIYYIIIYIAGLFIGFNRAIYSYTLTNLTRNILPTLVIIVLSEIIRYQMIKKSDKDMKVNLLSFFIFTLLEVSVNFKFYDFSISDDVYQYFGLVVIGGIAKNALLTVIYNKSDIYPGIVYRLLMEETKFIVLLVPALGPYLTSIAMIILPTTIAIMIINMSKKTTKEKPKNKNKHRTLYSILIVILLVLVLLNTGLMKYHIMVVGSNSMKNYMARGDLIFIERYRKDDRNSVKVGEILVFKYENKIICHRVVERLERGKAVYYETKGDANDQRDGAVIDKEKVMGKVLFRVKYLGLPSTWLYDLFNK